MATVAGLTGVEVAYAGRGAVLGPIDLEVAEGEIVALVGPSGCGKSTALRLLAGLEPPTAGEVSRAVRPGETAVVFQAPTLMPWASVLDNVALPLVLEGKPREAARALARAALSRVRLPDVEAARPCQLSGGMAMRASLARALVVEPRLLMLDEPFAALDEITRRALADDIHTLWCASRPAVVFVTHSVEEAAYMASRVVVLTPGPGRIARELAVEGPIPRPDGFRAAPGFRRTVEAVSAALAEAMAA